MMDPDDVDSATDAAHDAVTAEAVANELRARDGDGQTACANCGQALGGRYCSSCGQLADLFHRPLWSLIADGLDGLFSLEGRFFRTVPSLMLRPGRVSHTYLSGARARYMAPFRLFLFVSLIFFVVLFAVAGDVSEVVIPEQPSAAAPSELRTTAEDAANESARVGIGTTISDIEVGQSGNEASNTHPFAERFKCAFRDTFLPEEAAPDECVALRESGNQDVEVTTNGALLELPQNARAGIVSRLETAIDHPDAWVAAMQAWAPRLVFFLFPVYALMLALTHFWRRDVFVYDHIVVSLHFHSFLFILLLLSLGLSQLLPMVVVVAAGMVWSNYTLYRTLRLVYADSRFGAIARLVVLDIAYLFVLTAALVALVALGVAFV